MRVPAVQLVKPIYIPAALAGLFLILATPALVRAQYGQFGVPDLPTAARPERVKKIQDRYPAQPTAQPAFTISLASLEFTVPGNSYLLRKESLVSLDFLDEDRLLFTFHMASGLMSRGDDNSAEPTPQQIRALVLALPSGHIESRDTWTVPDRSRYLWMLNDGQFLLRVSEGLDQGDSQLKMKSSLRLPGKLLWIQMDPGKQFLMANSLVNATDVQGEGESSTVAEETPSPKTDGQKTGEVLVVRTIKRETGEVTHVSQVPWTHQTNDWPMNAEGYVERLQQKNGQWTLKFNSNSGKTSLMAGVESKCSQQFSFVSDNQLLVTTCDPEGGFSLKGVTTQGTLQWKQKLAWNIMWPLVVVGSDGSRFARSTLVLKRTINHYQKQLVGVSDLQGQMVRVFDASDGKIVLEAPLTPIFDNGGNVAISPSGKRVAIVNGGAIQVFQLPAPAAAPVRH